MKLSLLFRRVPITLITTHYDIVTINEEEVLLGGTAGNILWGYTLAILLVGVLLIAILIYLFTCIRYRKRIRGLDVDYYRHCGWNVFHLKRVIYEIESKLLDDMDIS